MNIDENNFNILIENIPQDIDNLTIDLKGRNSKPPKRVIIISFNFIHLRQIMVLDHVPL